MNLKLVSSHIFSSMLGISFVGIVLGMGARSVSAQSITVTTPFPFCVNNQAFPTGTYRFTRLSKEIFVMRNVNHADETLFQVHPGADGPGGWAHRPVRKAGEVTFHAFHNMEELEAVYDPGLGVDFELNGREFTRSCGRSHRPLKPKDCATKESAVSCRTASGQQ